MNTTPPLVNWAVVLLAGAALAVTVTAIFVQSGNRELQRDLARRQQEVNQALQLQPLNNQLIQTIAVMSVQRGDAQLSKVLADHGITVQANAPGAPATAAPAPSPAPAR
jgi:hypothetical protein